MKSIPASRYANSIPSVLSAGGNPLSLNAVFVTTNPAVQFGAAPSFPSVAAVVAFFGANSIEAQLAGVYFAGFNTANSLPSALIFWQWASAAIAAYIRGGKLGLTLTQLQALAGTLTIVIDSVSHVTGSINLASATSFTNAATLITTALAAATPTTSAICTYDSVRNAFVITSSTTGATSTIAFPTTDSFVTGLNLTSATGAVLSQGSAVQTPAATMNALVGVTQNWVTFMTVTDPDAGGEPATLKLQFAAWVSTATPAGKERFAYAAWDSDAAPAASAPAAASFGQAVIAAAYDGVVPIWDIASNASNPGVAGTTVPGAKAAFFCGSTASIDYTETQGRITFDYKSLSGLVPDVVDDLTAANLIANGYNFYGAAATANQSFQFFQPGSTPGQWIWADDYIDQIWLNQALQLALLLLMTTVKSLPYNTTGYALVRAACMDPITAALNAGVIQPGVPLSSAQAQEVNTAAGVKIDGVLSTQGWYLQILPASAIVRGQRGSPPITLWYTDGGSIQKITMASIDVQ